MVATVHSGALTRRMEQLCRFAVSPLGQIIVPRGDGFSIDPKQDIVPSAEGGVYAFWWVGDAAQLRQRSRRLILPGPGGRSVEIEFDDEWMGVDADLPIPLYVGKTADSLRRRLGQHLRLGSPRKVLTQGRGKAKAPTTTSQLRAGIERLFPRHERPVALIRECIGYSFVRLDGDQHAANRFYLEDLAIGTMRPILNVDIER